MVSLMRQQHNMKKYFVMPETAIFNEHSIMTQFYYDGRYHTEKEAYEAAQRLCAQYKCKFLVGTIDKVVEMKFDATIV